MGKRGIQFFFVFILSVVVQEQISVFAATTHECNNFLNSIQTLTSEEKNDDLLVDTKLALSHSNVSTNELRSLKRIIINFIHNISSHKPNLLYKLKLASCGPDCLKLHSKGQYKYEIKLDTYLKTPELRITHTTKSLLLPNFDLVYEPSFIELLKRFLIGHEIHPLVIQPKRHEESFSLSLALSALDHAFEQSSKGILVVGATELDTPRLLLEAIKAKIFEPHSKRISFVTTPTKIQAKALTASFKRELANSAINIVNLNDKDFTEVVEEIEKAQLKSKHTIFILNISRLATISEDMFISHYRKMIHDINGIFFQDAHQLNLLRNHTIYS